MLLARFDLLQAAPAIRSRVSFYRSQYLTRSPGCSISCPNLTAYKYLGTCRNTYWTLGRCCTLRQRITSSNRYGGITALSEYNCRSRKCSSTTARNPIHFRGSTMYREMLAANFERYCGSFSLTGAELSKVGCFTPDCSIGRPMIGKRSRESFFPARGRSMTWARCDMAPLRKTAWQLCTIRVRPVFPVTPVPVWQMGCEPTFRITRYKQFRHLQNTRRLYDLEGQ